MKKSAGVLTVEAALILPVFILTLLFIINFLNIFYLRLAIQQGMNHAANTLGEYCYVVDLAVGMDNLTLDENTKAKEDTISDDINDMFEAAQGTLEIMNGSLSLETLPQLVDKAVAFAESVGSMCTTLSGVTADDLVNFALAAAVEEGGGTLVEYMVDDYLDEMKVNRNLIKGDIDFKLRIDKGNGNNLVLVATYQYSDPMFSLFVNEINMCQAVVVHPWIGGETPGIRQK